MRINKIPFLAQLAIVVVSLLALESLAAIIALLLGVEHEWSVLFSVLPKLMVDSLFVIVLLKMWNIHLSTKLDRSTIREMLEVFIATALFLIVIFPFSFPLSFIKAVGNGAIQTFSFSVPQHSKTLLIYIFSIRAILIPIVEEFLFRGAIQAQLQKKYSPWLSILISSVVFAICHWSFARFFRVFLSGLLFGSIFYRYKSIYLSILSHIITNCIAFFMVVDTKPINEYISRLAILYLISGLVLAFMVKKSWRSFEKQ